MGQQICPVVCPVYYAIDCLLGSIELLVVDNMPMDFCEQVARGLSSGELQGASGHSEDGLESSVGCLALVSN